MKQPIEDMVKRLNDIGATVNIECCKMKLAPDIYSVVVNLGNKMINVGYRLPISEITTMIMEQYILEYIGRKNDNPIVRKANF